MLNLRNNRTFIVDDDPFWAAMLQQMLRELGFTNIIVYNNGQDCIDNLHLNPSLVFLDHQMEDMDGIEVLRNVKNYFPEIGVVFCTAHEDLTVAVSAIRNGSYDYLLKSNVNLKEIAALTEKYQLAA
ncbi:MAG: response regulator [Saprospiraceae bacterium]